MGDYTEKATEAPIPFTPPDEIARQLLFSRQLSFLALFAERGREAQLQAASRLRLDLTLVAQAAPPLVALALRRAPKRIGAYVEPTASGVKCVWERPRGPLSIERVTDKFELADATDEQVSTRVDAWLADIVAFVKHVVDEGVA